MLLLRDEVEDGGVVLGAERREVERLLQHGGVGVAHPGLLALLQQRQEVAGGIGAGGAWVRAAQRALGLACRAGGGARVSHVRAVGDAEVAIEAASGGQEHRALA